MGNESALDGSGPGGGSEFFLAGVATFLVAPLALFTEILDTQNRGASKNRMRPCLQENQQVSPTAKDPRI
jgi:hypothetical protein